MDIIGQNWIRFENNRKVKYRCSRSDFIVSGRFFDRGTWNYPEERFGRIENPLYFCTRRDGRVVDCGGLENRWAARLRGFESLSLRLKFNTTSPFSASSESGLIYETTPLFASNWLLGFIKCQSTPNVQLNCNRHFAPQLGDDIWGNTKVSGS